MTDPPHHETMSLQRDMNNARTYDHNFGVGKLEKIPRQQKQGTAAFNGDIADCLATNFAEARKRFRKTSGDTIDLAQFERCEPD